MDLVLYDSDCPPCVALAAFARRTAAGRVGFRSWSEFRGSLDAAGMPEELLGRPADRLRVVAAGTRELLEGAAAWAFLIERHPALKSLDWLAAKAGLSSSVPARALQSASEMLRRFCFRCKRT